jgi:hypothetical protein
MFALAKYSAGKILVRPHLLQMALPPGGPVVLVLL